MADAWVKTLKLIKVAEGSYAAVYRAQLKDNPGTFRILKLIPLRPREGLGSHQEDQTPIKDAIAEIQVSATMSEIPGFAEFASAQVLQGGLPKEFLQVNRDWSMTLNEKERAEIPNRANYPNTQNWLVIEMMDAGISLESVLYRGLPRWGSSFETQRLTVKRTWDIFWSVAEALADGEERARFEHRDLHPGNICIKKLDASDRNQSDIKQQRVTRESDVQVTLIDYTLSRATLADGTIVSNPMAVELCEQHSDDENDEMQYNLYRSMRKMVEGRQRAVSDWEKYVPMTNVLWLYHILTMMLRMIPSRRGRIGEEELVLQRTLTKLQADMHPDRIHVWDYLEAEDVVKGHEIGKLLMLDQVAYGTGDGDEIGRSVDYTGEGEHMTSARARRHKRVIDKREGRQY